MSTKFSEGSSVRGARWEVPADIQMRFGCWGVIWIIDVHPDALEANSSSRESLSLRKWQKKNATDQLHHQFQLAIVGYSSVKVDGMSFPLVD